MLQPLIQFAYECQLSIWNFKVTIQGLRYAEEIENTNSFRSGFQKYFKKTAVNNQTTWAFGKKHNQTKLPMCISLRKYYKYCVCQTSWSSLCLWPALQSFWRIQTTKYLEAFINLKCLVYSAHPITSFQKYQTLSLTNSRRIACDSDYKPSLTFLCSLKRSVFFSAT